MQADRTIDFHAQDGLYYKVKIPRVGRDMACSYTSCDLLIVGATSEAYRLNMEQGRFLSSFQTDANAINVTLLML
jgi:ribosome biogenesis protein ENP2